MPGNVAGRFVSRNFREDGRQWRGVCAAAALAASCALAGCTHTATIRTKDGRVIHGQILGRVNDELVVKPAWKEVGTVPAKEVEDIDHPGNTAMVVGTTLASVGLVYITAVQINASNDDCSTEGGVHDSQFCGESREFAAGIASGLAFATLVLPGGGIAIWGLSARLRSMSRAEGRSEDDSLSISSGPGVSATWKW